VLERRAGVVGHRVALRVQQRNPSDDPVRAVLGDLDGGCALLVDLDANLALVDCQAERPDGQAWTAWMISSIRPPLGATKASASPRKTVGSRSVQNPEWAHVPRLSPTVTCRPTLRVEPVRDRSGSLASLNPPSACVPSQRGLRSDRPQRHNAICGVVAISTPSQLRKCSGLVTR
jgi:hypothetical protein